MSTAQKKRLIKAEGVNARCIYASDVVFVYYCETSAGSIHITADRDMGEVCQASKLLRWLR